LGFVDASARGRAESNPPAAAYQFLREDVMTIEWRTDVDAALAEAKASRKPVLLDFTAAPI
jgi:thiol:disulfide interchange protein